MIKREIIDDFVRTYSDAGFKIERDGIRYDDAWDPVSLADERVYIETDEHVDE